MPKKNLFQDYFESVPKNKVPEPKVISETSDYVEMLVTDGRTGAQYKVKEKKPNGPQGNFSVPQAQAENRYRMIMGLPAATPFHFERPDDPFAEDREGPETAMSAHELEARIRDRISGDIKRSQALMPTRERPEDERPEEFEGPERPNHTVGLFGTEKDIHVNAAKSTRESEPSLSARGLFNGPERPLNVSADPLEAKIGESRGLQVLLTSAYRGLFGAMAADHIMTKSDLSDRRPGFERPVVTHAIQDHGLMKPWAPTTNVASDRPSRPENVEYAVGLRAINSIPKGPEAPDLQDLPKAERELLIRAVGRTVLHALTSMPDKTGDRPNIDVTNRRTQEIRDVIAKALKPELVRGLVPQELIMTDRREIDTTAIVRSGGSTQASFNSQRMPSAELSERLVRPISTGPAASGSFSMLGQFDSMRRLKKRPMFDQEENMPGVPDRQMPPIQNSTKSKSMFVINNSKNEINDRVMDSGLFHAH